MKDEHGGREKLSRNSSQITEVCLKTSFLPAKMWDVHMWRMVMKNKAYCLLGCSFYFPSFVTAFRPFNTLTNNILAGKCDV